MPKTITDYPQWVLGTLLDKYEDSTAFRTGVFSRRILLTIPKETRLQELLEQPDEKRLFLAALDRLKAQGLIDYSWVRYEQGNLVDKIWLVPENIGGCYQVLGRTSAADRLETFQQSVSAALEKLPPDSDFAAYLREVQQYTAARRKLRAPFSEDAALNENLLKCLVLLEDCPDLMERVFSGRYFSDSKYFERVLKGKVLSILKELHKRAPEAAEDGNSPLSDEDLLAERGLYRWPEVFEYSGALTVHMDDGSCFDTGVHRYGAYLNSEEVRHIAAVDGSAIRRVVFIENKANYMDFQARRRQPGDLVSRRLLQPGERTAVRQDLRGLSERGFLSLERHRPRRVPSVLPPAEQHRTDRSAAVHGCGNARTQCRLVHEDHGAGLPCTAVRSAGRCGICRVPGGYPVYARASRAAGAGESDRVTLSLYNFAAVYRCGFTTV